MDVSQIGGYIAIATPFILAAYAACNHKRLKSKCCGKMIEMSLDIEATTPPRSDKVEPEPMKEVVVVNTNDDPTLVSPSVASVASLRSLTPPSTPRVTGLPPFSPRIVGHKISPIAGSFRKSSR